MTAAAALFCLVVGVSDGDTLTARCGTPGAYEQMKVRISAIDAPESRQAFGQQSKQALSDLCFQQQVEIRRKDMDQYGRTVADVRCRGREVAAEQVSNGMAWVYDRYAKGYGHLYRLQDAARGGRIGLWRDVEPVAPWLWRSEQRR